VRARLRVGEGAGSLSEEKTTEQGVRTSRACGWGAGHDAVEVASSLVLSGTPAGGSSCTLIVIPIDEEACSDAVVLTRASTVVTLVSSCREGRAKQRKHIGRL
jgi:hypothetical protein